MFNPSYKRTGRFKLQTESNERGHLCQVFEERIISGVPTPQWIFLIEFQALSFFFAVAQGTAYMYERQKQCG